MNKTLLLIPLLAAPWLAGATPASPTSADGLPHAATRAEVRAELHQARITGRMSAGGEIGDTPEVLQAREDFNALQAEVLTQERQESEDARGDLAARD